jgi:hypothetical protein
MKTRRHLLSAFSVMAASAVIPMPKQALADESHAAKAGLLAALMKAKHGGNWAVKVDAKNEYILIFKKPA